MLPAAENNKITDSDPHKYLPACIQGLGLQAEQVFASNFLPSVHAFPYSSATFDEFVRARGLLLSEFIQGLCAAKKP
jgi:hypothetical protein